MDCISLTFNLVIYWEVKVFALSLLCGGETILCGIRTELKWLRWGRPDSSLNQLTSVNTNFLEALGLKVWIEPAII